jgi:hypothetical protein
MWRLSKNVRLKFCLSLCLFFVSVGWADEGPTTGAVERHTEEKTVRLFVGPELSTFSINNSSFVSLGVGATFFYAISPSWGGGFSLRQAFSSQNLSALFSEFDVEAKYALTGSLKLKKEALTVEGRTAFASQEENEGGFRAQFFLHQYFFNAGATVYPAPGAGIGLCYELASSSKDNYTVGIRIDRASTGTGITFYPAQLFLGIGFWL